MMEKDYIYIKVYNNTLFDKIILKDSNDIVVFTKVVDDSSIIKVPIYDNNLYKLFILSKERTFIIPLLARKEKTYNINTSINKEPHLITVLLFDANNPNLKIERGQMVLWQDIQSQ